MRAPHRLRPRVWLAAGSHRIANHILAILGAAGGGSHEDAARSHLRRIVVRKTKTIGGENGQVQVL